MIHLVVALPAEADPIVERLGLRREASARDLRLFASESVRLLVSGVGRAAAAEGVRQLRSRTAADDPLWINVGVAAHRSLEIGQLVVVTRVVDVGSGRSWKLSGVETQRLPQASAATVDRPQRELRDDRLYEMEAAGFAEAVLETATERRAACLKVVSDRGADSPGALTGQEVRALMARNAERLAEVIAAAVV